jgi:hypothetical protein
MPTYVSSTYMSLPVPIVGTTPGPDYATDINSCLTLVDQHDHSSGYGVQITPSGLNINADLTFGNNDAISLRSVRFQTQASPLAIASDLGCLYESGVDLYYNDGSGNQIRMTQAGGVAGTSGSIASLASPASATFVAGTGTFVWQSAANTPALMDSASVIIRNPTAAANGVTIAAANALAANYTITLPAALPAATNFMAISSAGNISAYAPVSLGIVAANIANATITTTQISASAAILGTQLSSSAAILGSQLSASAAIVGTQLSASANIAGSQLAAAAGITAAQLVSSINLVGTTVQANSKHVAVSQTNFSTPLGILPATFPTGSGAGYSVSGTGWSATGDYNNQVGTVTYTTAFASAPILMTSTVNSVANYVYITAQSASAFSFDTTAAATPGTITTFNFLAIGPR